MISRFAKILGIVAIASLFSIVALAYQTDISQPSSASSVTSAAPAQNQVQPQTNQTAKTNTAGLQKTTKQKPLATKPPKKHAVAKQDSNQPPAIPSALVGLDENNDPEKTVIRNGGAREIRLQLTPTATPEQTAQRRRQTRELLSVSNENLKRIAQLNLDPNQQDMLQQVHNYMEQARVADKTGELQRAQMLASKARQLSDDLVGARIFPKLWPW